MTFSSKVKTKSKFIVSGKTCAFCDKKCHLHHLHFIDLETNDQALSISLKGLQTNSPKNYLAYVLTKTICAVDETPLPGWTGFNKMLNNKEHDISKVAYLPVINASPTEYSMINAILTRRKEIADKLQLKYAVLVFDKVVYSKIQHIL